VVIGILGAGRMGRTLAALFVQAGHSVLLANSRGPESLAGAVAELGPRASAVDRLEVARGADVVVLATRWEQTANAVAGLGPWPGTIVVDTTNNRFGPGPDDVYDLGARISSEVVAELVPGARLVKAFNHQPVPALAEELGPSPGEHNALFVSGDDAEARATVAGLIRDIGGEPFDLGSLRGGGPLHATGGGPLAGHGRLLTPAEAGAIIERSRVPR
jgi:predicted dinucleotide-binding enzyme